MACWSLETIWILFEINIILAKDFLAEMLKFSVTKSNLILSDGGKKTTWFVGKGHLAYQCNGTTINFPLHFY